MKRKWHIIPEFENREAFATLAAEYGAAFEYNDFYLPEVYENEGEVERRIQGYLALDRDRSGDTLHGAFLDVVVSSEDSYIAEYSRKRMHQSMEIAERLGIRGVVFHSGLLRGITGDAYIKNWVQQQSMFFRRLAEEFPRLEIYMENTQEETPEALLLLKKELKNCPRFLFCLDYGHAVISGTKPAVWLEAFRGNLGHMHINDNDGSRDLHQVPGTGSIDWKRFALETTWLPEVPVLIEIKGLRQQRQALKFLTELKEDKCSVVSLDKENCMDCCKKELAEILEIGIQMAKEKDRNHLLDMILHKSMEYTNCDGGTLYLYREGTLMFKLMKTNSLHISRGEKGEEIDLPPVPMKEENICAYSALHRKVLNIPDVENCDMFDFSGPKRYDQMTGYRTRSMLVVPMSNHEGELIGVLQLLNAQDESGTVISFGKETEQVICALASQAAIVLSNLLYVEEIRQLMWSFTEALAETVDARTPYSGSHIHKVAEYVGKLADYINVLHEQGLEEEYFDQQRKDQLVMGALLHDIGKLVIPLEIMNKAKRLEGKSEVLFARLDLISAYYEIDALRGRISMEEAKQRQEDICHMKRVVELVDSAQIVPPKLRGELECYIDMVYESEDRENIPYFTEEEKVCLRVTRGTITKEERKIMEGHVAATERILSKVHFNSYYANSPIWAVTHHELLDGSGYPRGLKGEELALESRMMTVADICDALLASDRPYKKPLPKDKTFEIMAAMAEEGKLDKKLVQYLKECL